MLLRDHTIPDGRELYSSYELNSARYKSECITQEINSMMTFYIKYKTGATFTYVHEVRNAIWLKYYMDQFYRDPSVVRVLAEVV